MRIGAVYIHWCNFRLEEGLKLGGEFNEAVACVVGEVGDVDAWALTGHGGRGGS